VGITVFETKPAGGVQHWLLSRPLLCSRQRPTIFATSDIGSSVNAALLGVPF
jgi:hypothetical protein